jgi:GT2 family glycosyltransferase
MEPGNIPFVTVVVPMYNERACIGECLGSLVKTDYPADHFEVLVLDGKSDDGSRNIVLELARMHNFIRLLDNPRRITAAAMNVGIQAARGDVIIVLSAHSFVASDFISQNVACLSKTGADCVGGPIHSTSQPFPGKTISLAMSSPFGVGNALFRYSQKEQYVDTVAFGAYRRQVFDEIGLFDEELVYNEDDEFNYRLRKHGGKIFLTPSIKSFYHTKTSLGQLWKQYFRYGLGKVRVIQRHPEATMIRHLVPFTFVSTLLVSGLLGLFSPIFLRLCLLVLASYLAASLLFSFRIAARNGWKHLPVLPVVFACLHFSYGLGFSTGLLKLGRGYIQAATRSVVSNKIVQET